MLLKLERSLVNKLRLMKQLTMMAIMGIALSLPLKALDVDEDGATSSSTKYTILHPEMKDVMYHLSQYLLAGDLDNTWATGDKNIQDFLSHSVTIINQMIFEDNTDIERQLNSRFPNVKTLMCELSEYPGRGMYTNDPNYNLDFLTRLLKLETLILNIGDGGGILIPDSLFHLDVAMSEATIMFEKGNHNLQTLVLRGNPDDVIQHIKYKNIVFPHLVSLSLFDLYYFHELEQILKFMPSLTELSIIPQYESGHIKYVFKAISSMTQLKKLSLRVDERMNEEYFGSIDVKHFTTMTCSLTRLTDLSLSRRMFPESMLTHQIFTQLQKFSCLQNLRLYDFESIDASDVRELPSVKSLKLLIEEFNQAQQFPFECFDLLPSSLISFHIDKGYFAEPEDVLWRLLELLPCPGLKGIFVGDEYFPTTPALSSNENKRPREESEYEDYSSAAKRHKGS